MAVPALRNMRTFLVCFVVPMLACQVGGMEPSNPRPSTKPANDRCLDCDGEPLPPGVLARLGSARLRPGAHVAGMTASPDGHLLATVYSDDPHCDLWDTGTGKRVRRIDLRLSSKNWYTKTAFIDRGATLLIMTGDKRVVARWFDVATGQERRRVELHDSSDPGFLALAPRAALAAVAGQDRMVRLYNLATGLQLRRWEVPGRMAYRMTFSAGGGLLAVCDLSDTVRVYDTRTGRERGAFKGKDGQITMAVISPDDRFLATYFFPMARVKPGPVTIWDLATGKERCRLENTQMFVVARAFSPDGKLLATGGLGKDVVVWDTRTGKEVRRLRTWPLVMHALFFAGGKSLAVETSSGTITLWDMATGKLLPASADPIRGVRSAAFSRDGRQVIGQADRLIAWEAATGRVVRRFPLVSDSQFPLYALSANHALLASAEREGTLPAIGVYDAHTGKKLRCLRGHGEGDIFALLFMPDGRLLSAGLDDTVQVWDPLTGREVYRLAGMGSVLAVSPDGRWLANDSAAAHARGASDVRLWDLKTGQETRRFPGRGPTYALAFSPDGRYLAGVGDGLGPGNNRGEVEVWETGTGKEWRFLDGHKNAVLHVAWSPDGRMLATGAADHSVRLWELATAGERRRLTTLGDPTGVSFAPDGRRLAVASDDAPVLIYDLIYPKPGRPLSAEELKASWATLAKPDAAGAWQTMVGLIAEPEQAVPFLRTHLQPVASPDAKVLARLVADLDSGRFATRTKAMAELTKLGSLAEPALRRVLAGHPSVEVRRQVEQLLRQLNESPPDELRGLRAVEVLERIGTTQARAVLSSLLSGAPAAPLTRAAARALNRIKGQ